MKTIHRKLTLILTFVVACTVFVFGLFCVYKPIQAKAAETVGFSVREPGNIGVEKIVLSPGEIVF